MQSFQRANSAKASRYSTKARPVPCMTTTSSTGWRALSICGGTYMQYEKRGSLRAAKMVLCPRS